MSRTVEVTIEEVYKAIVKNGFGHLRRRWLETDSYGNIIGGCVLGQTAVNLGVSPNNLYSSHGLESRLNVIRIGERELNHHIRKDFPYGGGLGALLITINDTQNSRGEFVYTWKQIVRLAKKWMKPRFKEIITVDTYEFKVATNV